MQLKIFIKITRNSCFLNCPTGLNPLKSRILLQKNISLRDLHQMALIPPNTQSEKQVPIAATEC